MWSGITPRFAPRSWDARLGARRAVQLAKQASCNDAVRPNPPVQIGEVISDHILTTSRQPAAIHLELPPGALSFSLAARGKQTANSGQHDANDGQSQQGIEVLVEHQSIDLANNAATSSPMLVTIPDPSVDCFLGHSVDHISLSIDQIPGWKPGLLPLLDFPEPA